MNSVGPARGLLQRAAPGQFHHARLAPPGDLAHLIRHFWIVRWQLRGEAPQRPETLPHPNVHLIFERGCTRVYGIHAGRFTAELQGEGCVFGVKFRAGGFRPFLGRAVSTLRGRSLPATAVFGADVARVEAELLAHSGDESMMAVAVDFLRARLPPPDPAVAQAATIVEAIEAELGIIRVEHLIDRWGMSTRALQRLFNEYVGVSPKWVINRYRLHEALERAKAQSVNWTDLALELGYFDQAHFIRDFKALVGRPPAAYARGA